MTRRVRHWRDHGYTYNEFLVTLGVLALIVVLIAPGLVRRYRATANEDAAISLLRAMKAAQTAYAASCGRGGYATSFHVLRGHVPVPGAAADLALDASTLRYKGYRFVLTRGRGSVDGPADCRGRPTSTSYSMSAQPDWPGVIAWRGFTLDPTGSVTERDVRTGLR